MVCSAVTNPRAVPDPVNWRTSSPCATVCIQVPDREIPWPTTQSR